MANSIIENNRYKAGDSVSISIAGGVFSGFLISDKVVRMMIPLSKLVSSGVTAKVYGSFSVRCGTTAVAINIAQGSALTGTVSASGIVIDLTDDTTVIGTELVCAVGISGLTINFI